MNEQQRDADRKLALDLLTDCAKAHGMTLTENAVYRSITISDAGGNEVLHLYRSESWRSYRVWVKGRFVPYVKHSSRRGSNSFWRASWEKAATDALQYVRTLKHAERVEMQRTRARDVASTQPYRGKQGSRYVGEWNVRAFALEAYMNGNFRTGDQHIDDEMCSLYWNLQERISDDLWFWLIDTSFAPAFKRAGELDRAVTA